MLAQQDKFIPADQIKIIRPDASYWIIQDIVNNFDQDKRIQIDSSGWRELSPYVIRNDGEILRLKPAGFEISNFNFYVTGSPSVTAISKFESPFARFLIRKGERVTVLSKAVFHPIFPAKSFSISFIDSDSYSDFRRFGLYMEGALLGTLFALMIFSIFNAVQSSDKVNRYYALWIIIAFFSVASMNVIDGNRLFEFFINIENLKAPWSDTYAYIIFVGFAFAQSISYILFARQYLGIKTYFPKIQFVTNIFIVYALVYCFAALTGGFYGETMAVIGQWVAKTYSVMVGAILLTFFICSYLRYRAGFVFALFFTYAIVPYLIFRLSFLFGTIGMPTPFQHLPDHGLGYFLKNPFTNQAFGVCLEGLIMALAVISRARWLQGELTLSMRAQQDLVENQNKILEETVAARTRELAEQHRELDQAHRFIVSSVDYASRLQRSQLPKPYRIEGRFASLGTIWEPRDTIGGDLWWLSSSQRAGPFMLAVADCTGHGVPGAMLSLLVSNSLERIYSADPNKSPSEALMTLDFLVRNGLNQDTEDSESDDGCDAMIMRIDREQHTIVFAGAKIGAFQLTTRGEVIRHMATRASLGYCQKPDPEDEPNDQRIAYTPGDAFVIVTDGFTDQIGGNPASPSSFGYRRIEQLLSGLANCSAEKITDRMKEEFDLWRGEQKRRDDLTVIAFTL